MKKITIEIIMTDEYYEKLGGLQGIEDSLDIPEKKDEIKKVTVTSSNTNKCK